MTVWMMAVLVLFGPLDSGPGLDGAENVSDQPERRLPNLVLIFTDDQGYQDIGCFGAPNIRTPNLDQLARNGRRFTSFYSACSVCSPSRAALLTGCYPPRTGVTRVLFPKDRTGLADSEVTIAEVLKTKGYRTACIGKWHLGHLPEFLPTRQGFDSYFGIPYSNDMQIASDARLAGNVVLEEGITREQIRSTPQKEQPRNKVPLMRNEEVIEYPVDQSQLTQRYTEEAVRFIDECGDEPFFLYLPHTMPHIPLFASESFAGKSQGGLYGDTIEEIDWSVGKILQALKDNGLEEETLVIYTSDNGPWDLKNGHGGSAAPLRGFKFNTYEGGMRVPCIMSWPGKIPAGTQTAEIASTIDLFPTLAKLAGAESSEGRLIDGRDIYPLMTTDAGSPHEAFFYFKGTTISALRIGNWKLRVIPPKPKKELPETVELFDLDADLSESSNLAEANPSRVLEMLKIRKQFQSEMDAESRPIGQSETASGETNRTTD